MRAPDSILRYPGAYDAQGLLKWILVKAELAYATISLVLLTGAFSFFFAPIEASTSDGNGLAQSVFAGIYLIALCLIVLRPKELARFLLSERLLPLLTLFAVASTAWSTTPELTLRRSLALAGTMVFGIYLANRFNLQQLLALLAWTSIAIITLSVVFALFYPQIGQMQAIHFGAWRGVFIHKNILGRFMTLSFLILVQYSMQRPRHSWLYWMFALASLLVLHRSQSASAAVVLAACLLALALAPAFQLRSNLALLVLLTVILGLGGTAIYLLDHSEGVLSLLDRDLTLTGRTDLWRLIIGAIHERPWLGYGYGSFWTNWFGPSGELWARLGWEAPHAHNGALELLLDIGIIGSALFFASLARTVRRALLSTQPAIQLHNYWGLIFLIFLLLVNVTESAFLSQNNIFWAVQVAITLHLAVYSRSTRKGQDGSVH